MTGYEVWFANEKSPQMEKCPTMWKTKERAEANHIWYVLTPRKK